MSSKGTNNQIYAIIRLPRDLKILISRRRPIKKTWVSYDGIKFLLDPVVDHKHDYCNYYFCTYDIDGFYCICGEQFHVLCNHKNPDHHRLPRGSGRSIFRRKSMQKYLARYHDFLDIWNLVVSHSSFNESRGKILRFWHQRSQHQRSQQGATLLSNVTIQCDLHKKEGDSSLTEINKHVFVL